MKKKQKHQFVKVDYPVFSVVTACCILFYLPMVLFQDKMSVLVPNLLNDVTFTLDWVFEIVAFVSLVYCLWLVFGRYGRIKLGSEEDEPEFSTFTWFGMFFTAGVGAGAIYWAFLEPITLLAEPPFGIAPNSLEATQWTLAYPCFHWSFTPWAIFAVPAVAFAYGFYNKGRNTLRASDACSDMIKGRHAGLIGKIIDIFVIIGLFGGLVTSLGFCFPMIAGLISDFFGIEDSLTTQILVGLVFTMVVCYCCYRGLYSGIANLSNINMYLFFVIFLFIFFVGPTRWIISNCVESVAIMLQNYIRMSFYTDAVSGSGFPQKWTVFYWAWWLSWAVYIGIFMARISKGRTIRAFVANMLFTAGGGSILIFAIIGGYTEHTIWENGFDFLPLINSGQGYHAISIVLNTLPLAKLVIPLLIWPDPAVICPG